MGEPRFAMNASTFVREKSNNYVKHVYFCMDRMEEDF